MTDLICKFESFLKEKKQASDNTVASYVRDVSKFNIFLGYDHFQNFKNCDENDVERYIKQLQTAGKSSATINRVIASLRAFFTFLHSVDAISQNPVKRIKSGKKEKALPRVLTNKEVDLFLSQPKSNTLKGYRDKAMLELLYATGIRVSELIELNLNDVNTLLGFIRCKKGDSERIIPLYPAAVYAIDRYIKESRPLLLASQTEDALFVNLNGTRMTRQGFWKIIKFYQQKSGIQTDITPHTLRHSFAVHLLENGADMSAIKELLGHSDISSTLVYAQFIKNNLKTSYVKFHPRA